MTHTKEQRETDAIVAVFEERDRLRAQVSRSDADLRDRFAIAALATLSRNNPDLPGDKASVAAYPDADELVRRRAVWAYLQADAMLAARVEP